MQAAQRKLEEKMDLMLSTMNDKNLVIDSLHKRAEESGKETQEIIGEIKQINHKIDEIVHSKSKKMLPWKFTENMLSIVAICREFSQQIYFRSRAH